MFHLPRVHRLVLKLDGDVFDFAPFKVQFGSGLAMCRLSAAFTTPKVTASMVTMHRLRTLDLDFEGCNFVEDNWMQLVRFLGHQVGPWLRSLRLNVSHGNMGRDDIRILFQQAIHRMLNLEFLQLGFTCMDEWDATLDQLLQDLPRSLISMTLELGSMRLVRSQALHGLWWLEHLTLLLPESRVEELELPPRLKTFTLDVCSGRLQCSLAIPPTTTKITIFAIQADVPVEMLQLEQEHKELRQTELFLSGVRQASCLLNAWCVGKKCHK